MKRFMPWALVFAVAFMFSGCTPRRDTIPTFRGNTPAQAFLASHLHAQDIGGQALRTEGKSMEPTIVATDYVVVDTKFQFKDVKAGMALCYQARWLPRTALPVSHWASEKSGDEFIMDGENNRRYERGDAMRMGQAEFEYVAPDGVRKTGRIIAIYTTRP